MGSDVRTGGSNSGSGTVANYLYGDAQFNGHYTAQGGNDRLISGTNAPDHMWGDWEFDSGPGGSDTFVFAGAFGTDYIYDFDQADSDLIEFQVKKLKSFDSLDIDYTSGDAVITATKFSSGSNVTVVGYDGTDAEHTLTANDFLFT